MTLKPIHYELTVGERYMTAAMNSIRKLCGSNVLIICPHTDDEFGCAGTISRIQEEGIDIKYVALSRCELSVPPDYPQDILETECRQCLTALGVKEELVQVMGFPVRRFPEFRQEILDVLVKLNRELGPDLVLVPNACDTHQDHRTVFEECFRAFKHCSVLGYELPQNLIRFTNSAFIKLSEDNIDKKIIALSKYESQSFRPYAADEFIRGLASVRGVQCNARYAEAYEVIRLIA